MESAVVSAGVVLLFLLQAPFIIIFFSSQKDPHHLERLIWLYCSANPSGHSVCCYLRKSNLANDLSRKQAGLELFTWFICESVGMSRAFCFHICRSQRQIGLGYPPLPPSLKALSPGERNVCNGVAPLRFCFDKGSLKFKFI